MPDLVSDTGHDAEKGHSSMPSTVEYGVVDKFASQWQSGTDLETGTDFHSVAKVSETVSAGDMPQVSTTSHAYDEDEEVIEYEHWEDAWQKNDSGDSHTDVILKNVRTSDAEVKIRTRSFLEKWRDIFSRTLSKEPANLAPLEIEVDAEKWQTRRS